MADASDTMRYLVKQVDIAPAGTREEGEAAKNLSVVFHKHGLETANKSFKFSPFAKTAVALWRGSQESSASFRAWRRACSP